MTVDILYLMIALIVGWQCFITSAQSCFTKPKVAFYLKLKPAVGCPPFGPILGGKTNHDGFT